MATSRELWRSEDRRRWFLIPVGEVPAEGDLSIRSAAGEGAASVDRAWAARFETSEEEGRAWAKAELGATLGELRQSIDAGLAGMRDRLDEAKRTPVVDDSAITPDAGPALLELLKSLPRLIVDSLSGKSGRVEAAKGSAGDLERRLRDSGLDLDGGLSRFPERLAGLRKDFSDRKPGEPSAES